MIYAESEPLAATDTGLKDAPSVKGCVPCSWPSLACWCPPMWGWPGYKMLNTCRQLMLSKLTIASVSERYCIALHMPCICGGTADEDIKRCATDYTLRHR
jgi:hypothetical protein